MARATRFADDSAHAAPTPAAVAVGGLIALAVAMGIGRFAFTPILPMMLADSGLTLAEGSWLASANYAGYLAGALWALRARPSPAGAVRINLVAVAAFTLAMAAPLGFAMWFALRFAAGVASAGVLVFATAWALARLSTLRRAALTATVFAGVGVGIVGAGLAAVALMHWHAGSRIAWLVLGGAAALATAAAWPLLRDGAAPRAGRDAAADRGAAACRSDAPRRQPAPARTADSLRLVICYGAFGAGYIIPATFLPVLAQQRIEQPLVFGLAWPLFGAAAVASTFVAAAATQRLGNRSVWAAGHGVMAAGLVMPLAVPTLGGIAIAALAVGGTFMLITQAGLQEARRIGGERATTLIAAMTSAFAAGQIAGPLAASAAVSLSASFAPALLGAAALLVLAAFALLLRPPISSHASDGES